MSPLFGIWNRIQNTLFPWLEDKLEPLTEKQQEFVRVIELADVQKHIRPYRWRGVGRKRDDRPCFGVDGDVFESRLDLVPRLACKLLAAEVVEPCSGREPNSFCHETRFGVGAFRDRGSKQL